jgi:hypothetical protein
VQCVCRQARLLSFLSSLLYAAGLLLGDAIKIRKLREEANANERRDGTERASFAALRDALASAQRAKQLTTHDQPLLRKRQHGDSASCDADAQQTGQTDADDDAREPSHATLTSANDRDVGNDKESTSQRRQLLLRHSRSSSAHVHNN